MLNEDHRYIIAAGNPRGTVLAGLLSSWILFIIPLIIALLNDLINWVILACKAGSLSTGLVLLRRGADSIVPYLCQYRALAEISGFGIVISLLNRYNHLRHRVFHWNIRSRFDLVIGREFLLALWIVPVYIYFLHSQMSSNLSFGVGLPLSGFILYFSWEIFYDFLIERLEFMSDKKRIIDYTIRELFTRNDALNGCTIQAKVEDDGQTVFLSGTVIDPEQVTTARCAALNIRGVINVDSSALKLGKSKLFEGNGRLFV